MSGMKHMMPGERVAWEGRPRGGIIFTAMDIFMIPFSLVWGGGVIAIMIAALQDGGPFPWPILFFVAIGLYFIVGRFFTDMFVRSRMRYFVTTQRVVITRAGGSRVKSLDIKRLPMLEMSERGDGSGTIRFGESGGIWGGRNLHAWSPAMDPSPQFLRIENVQSVYMLIRKQAEA